MKHNYFDRFKKISPADWVIIALMTALLAFLLYMSISFSVKMGQGYTLFGDSSSYSTTVVESIGPTSADVSVLILFWIVTALLLAVDVFFTFFKDLSVKKSVHKEIVNGQTVIIQEEKND